MNLMTMRLLVSGVHLLAVAMPGPDFFCVSQSSIKYGRKAGFAVSAGICAAMVFHILAGMLGLAALLANPKVLMVIKLLCGAYLLYLGWKGITAKASDGAPETEQTLNVESNYALFRKGFWCNLLNPKAPIYFLSLFTVILPQDITYSEISAVGAMMLVIAFAWSGFVATLFATPRVQRQFQKMGVWIDRVAGTLFAGFGASVVLTARQ